MHGDKLNSLISMALFAAQHCMIWGGLELFAGKLMQHRLGGWLDAIAQSEVHRPM